MKVKEFLKSQTFKCILVLLIIALISGGLLAIANGILSVSEEERTKRAIKSFYNKEMKYETVFDLDKIDGSENEEKIKGTDIGNGYIEKCYLIVDDGNYLIKATGKEGYKSGTVTVWAVVNGKGEITKVTIASYDKQTLMSKFDSGVLAGATSGENVVVSGATFSAKAFNNALASIREYAEKGLMLTASVKE